MAGVIESLLFSSPLFSPSLSTSLISSISNLSKSRLLPTTACPSQGYLSMTCLLMTTFKAARQWQGRLSKAGSLLVKAKTTCQNQDCLSMSTRPSQDYLSRSRPLVNLLVQGKAKARLPVKDYLSRARLLVQFPSQGCLSGATLERILCQRILCQK
jgi:hypothetical protein